MAGEQQDVESELSSRSCEIIIIGAGLAGVTAANYLTEKGNSNFKILEARNRIGGRIMTITLGNEKIELGANWIHGVLGNPIYELALTNKLVDITLEKKIHNVIATTEHGKKVPILILQEVYEKYFWFYKRCEDYFMSKKATPNSMKSVGEHMDQDISNYLQSFNKDEALVRRMIFDHLMSRETCISGCDSMHDVDLSDFGSYSELPGGNVVIPCGFFSVFGTLASNLDVDECILKERIVNCIRWKWGRATTPSTPQTTPSTEPNAKRMVQIECENGDLFECNHVIVTVPLGVLKAKHAELFDPPLPDYKINSIDKLGFGTVDKIFLEYQRPFLHPDISEVITLWDPTNQTDDVEDLSKTWFKKIYSFMKLSDTLFLAWLSGKEAEYAEKLSAEEIADVCTNLLRKFLNDPYIPKPMRVVRTRWFNEPYTRGSYTCIAMGSKQSDIEHLAKPIYVHPYDTKPTLLFAGEATHPTFFSTTHGAFLSAKRAVDLLMNSDSVFSGECGEAEMMSSWIEGLSLK